LRRDKNIILLHFWKKLRAKDEDKKVHKKYTT